MTQIHGITGMPLSGKTTVAEIMQEKHGYTLLDMGEIVRIEMDKRNIDTENTGEFVNQMRETHGMNAIAQLTTPYLKEIIEEKNKIVITGMRSTEEKQKFEQETGENINMIAVWTPTQTRKQRRKNRQREEDKVGDKFHQRDQREIQNGVAKLITQSNQLIKNNNITMNELEKEVNQLVN